MGTCRGRSSPVEVTFGQKRQFQSPLKIRDKMKNQHATKGKMQTSGASVRKLATAGGGSVARSRAAKAQRRGDGAGGPENDARDPQNPVVFIDLTEEVATVRSNKMKSVAVRKHRGGGKQRQRRGETADAAYVYVLVTRSNKFSYTGSTLDLKHRLRQHNCEITGGARYTKRRVLAGDVWRIACRVTVSSLKDATSLEAAWKKMSKKFAHKKVPVVEKKRAALEALIASGLAFAHVVEWFATEAEQWKVTGVIDLTGDI